MIAPKALQNILLLTLGKVFVSFPFLPTTILRRQKHHYLLDKYSLLQDSVFLVSRAGNLPGMVQFADWDCSRSTRKYDLSKVLHMSQHTDIEPPLPSAREKNSDLWEVERLGGGGGEGEGG